MISKRCRIRGGNQEVKIIIAAIIRRKRIQFQHLGESGSMTKGSVRVVMTSEKKGMTWDGLEPSTMACRREEKRREEKRREEKRREEKRREEKRREEKRT